MPIRLVVPAELAGLRLDIAVTRLAPQLSRRQTKRLVEDGLVFVDGKRVQVCSRAVRTGGQLLIEDQAPQHDDAPAPRVLALDADIVVVDKPAGVPTEPTREGSRGTLLASLKDELNARGVQTNFLHAVHRLDTHTTGVVMFARNADAAHALGRQLHDGLAERRYLALVAGCPPWLRARLDFPLAKNRGDDGKIRIDENGAAAVTLATVLVPGAALSLVLCAPRTGRTHQLRAHLERAGHPLVGDRLYGGSKRSHLGLHALSIAVAHPESSLGVRFVAPPPPELLEVAAQGGIPAAVVLAAARAVVPELAEVGA
ncbi:MAG TPA: RluA family pseudouridine synthase [Myxococcota bacterium]|jgi:23S rRNA pseudouridine1911/1915/1917 synthase